MSAAKHASEACNEERCERTDEQTAQHSTQCGMASYHFHSLLFSVAWLVPYSPFPYSLFPHYRHSCFSTQFSPRSVYKFHRCFLLVVCLFVFPFTYIPELNFSSHIFFLSISGCLFVCLFFSLFVFLSVCQSVCLSVCMYVCLYVKLSLFFYLSLFPSRVFRSSDRRLPYFPSALFFDFFHAIPLSR